MTPPLDLGGVLFESKKAATARVREILRTNPHGVPLAGADFEIVRALLDRHPRATEKVGAGVAAITVDRVEHGSPGFWVHRVDGTLTDFSHRAAMTAPSHATRVASALRRAVEDTVVGWKRDLFEQTATVVCPLTGATLDRRHGHVDHVIPFADLVDGWLRARRMTVDDIAVVSADGQAGPRFADPWLEQDWRDWHDRHARLRYIHPSANQRRAS